MRLDEQLTVRFYLDAVRRRWWLVGAVALIVAVAGTAPAVLEEPEYRSAVTIRIHSSESSTSDPAETSTASGAVVSGAVLDVLTQVEIVESAGMRSAVDDELDDPGAVRDVSAVVEGFSWLITIRVTATSPEAARDAAAAFASTYLDQRRAEVVDPLLEQAAALESDREELIEQRAAVDDQLADPATEPFRLGALGLERTSLDVEARSLGKRIDELGVEAERRDAQTTVVSEPSLPDEPLPRGRTRAAATALALGLAGGLVLAVLIELFRDRITGGADLATIDTDVPVFERWSVGSPAVIDELLARGVDGRDAVAVVSLTEDPVPAVLQEDLARIFDRVSVDHRGPTDTAPVLGASLDGATAAVVVVGVGDTRRSAVRSVYRSLEHHGVDRLTVTVDPTPR